MKQQLKQSRHRESEQGFALLIAVLISSVVLAVGISMLNVTLKQYLFSGIGRESEVAFYAADAGMECALYWDASSQGGKFDLTAVVGNISCMGTTVVTPAGGSSGTQKQFQFEWTSTTGQTVCSKIGITKYFDATADVPMPGWGDCERGATCTQVESRGYNRSCSSLDSPRVVERALRANY